MEEISYKNKANSKGGKVMLYTYNKLIRDNNVKIMEDKCQKTIFYYKNRTKVLFSLKKLYLKKD